jgi:hypothetical protein
MASKSTKKNTTAQPVTDSSAETAVTSQSNGSEYLVYMDEHNRAIAVGNYLAARNNVVDCKVFFGHVEGVQNNFYPGVPLKGDFVEAGKKDAHDRKTQRYGKYNLTCVRDAIVVSIKEFGDNITFENFKETVNSPLLNGDNKPLEVKIYFNWVYDNDADTMGHRGKIVAFKFNTDKFDEDDFAVEIANRLLGLLKDDIAKRS